MIDPGEWHFLFYFLFDESTTKKLYRPRHVPIAAVAWRSLPEMLLLINIIRIWYHAGIPPVLLSTHLDGQTFHQKSFGVVLHLPSVLFYIYQDIEGPSLIQDMMRTPPRADPSLTIGP
ncbi:hypothetical protein GDO81_027393 [Engystomops pustulosus]|uniref:Uncharacterized protein n=1 Tax=Engystomops pustulosus TaxID=76066 RepID=A0AAV6ZE96_ENGPU|nr:hypothetical protein GDO81_027393 [Engystomops pustulosus]